MNLKGTQCAHCREIYSLLKNKSMYFIWALYDSLCLFLCVNIMVVSVFWSEPKLIYDDLVD